MVSYLSSIVNKSLCSYHNILHNKFSVDMNEACKRNQVTSTSIAIIAIFSLGLLQQAYNEYGLPGKLVSFSARCVVGALGLSYALANFNFYLCCPTQQSSNN